ncbi:MAG: carbohydrate binding domain-containing protein [Acidobacteria bacterium]|nr:carbohydrate binding domain-containing protein [Acidobacteriota bacterium]
MQRLFLLAVLAAAPLAAQCDVALAPSSDFRHLIARLPAGQIGDFRWFRNGQAVAQGSVPRTVFLPAGEPTGQHRFSRDGLLHLTGGGVEMWIRAREDGSSARYAQSNTILRYSAGADNFNIAQAGRDGTIYLGGTVNGQWESAYGGRASMRGWSAGERHHIAATWSAADNFMRFYLDGVRTADTNEHHYWPAAETSATFTLDDSAFQIEAVRFWMSPPPQDEIRGGARRADLPQADEVWFPLDDAAPADRISFETAGCTAVSYVFAGLPILNASPASTLLPPETTSLELTVRTRVETSCRYALNRAPAFDEMAEFAQTGLTTHVTRVEGLSPHPADVNEVFVRCASDPTYALRLIYRSLGRFNPSFPRLGNLWGSSNMLAKGHAYAAQVKGYFGAEMSPGDIRALRRLNPDILILTSINTVENSGVPEDYYLHDTRGNRIEVWPGTYRLNLTRREVAEYQAQFAYQKMLDSELLYDGCFFDNFFTSQSWLRADIHGRAVQLDADGDGKPDDPAWLDAEWRKGVFHELNLWRELMPHALATGHLSRPSPPELGEIFNGNSVLFSATNVVDGTSSFTDLWEAYHQWWEMGRAPVITELESSPMNQIAYGYGYSPFRDAPASTIEFAKNYHQYMRFGLANALMNDGYSWHDFGDIVHGVDWPYDDYSFDLGHPLGPAERITTRPAAAVNLIVNGGFEEPLSGTWNLSVSNSAALATLTRDNDAAEGGFSALVSITDAAQGVNWHIDFNQRDRSLRKGVSYDLTFWAKADAPRPVSLASQKGSPDWRNYGLSKTLSLTTEWKKYAVLFTANQTAADSPHPVLPRHAYRKGLDRRCDSDRASGPALPTPLHQRHGAAERYCESRNAPRARRLRALPGRSGCPPSVHRR